VINNKQLPVSLEPDQFTNLIDVSDINIQWEQKVFVQGNFL